MTQQATLLSIAGSDPSGGAGIQADLKTMTAIGVFGAAAISCLTVQNSMGVKKIHPLPPELVQAQIKDVLADHLVSHIKIGMLGNSAIADGVSEILSAYKGIVIYDPVLAATTGESLSEIKHADLQRFLKHVSYLTPNIHELEYLTGCSINSETQAVTCAADLLAAYPAMTGVVVKGGHLKETSTTVIDYLVLREDTIYESKRERIDNPNLHGTGCTYASALASFLVLGLTPIKSFEEAGRFMDAIIRAASSLRIADAATNGPLIHHLWHTKTAKLF